MSVIDMTLTQAEFEERLKKYEPQPFDKNTDLCATCWHPLLAHSRAGDTRNAE